MGLSNKIRTIFRGDVAMADLPREALRRKQAAARRKVERASLDELAAAPARLGDAYRSLSQDDLAGHFCGRANAFFPKTIDGANDEVAGLQSELFPGDTARLIALAGDVADRSTWELAGLGTFEFTGADVWRRDPLTGKDWGLEYHHDVVLFEDDGADIRILWELNRFGHVMDLARAYCVTRDESFAETFFLQIDAWMRQNPYGRGANWASAMEVAIRAINILAAFDLLRRSAACTPERVARVLQLADQHGRFILDNNEFSFIATSNHYLTNVCGLFWIGTFLPELEHAAGWQRFGLAETLKEIDKQILPDGTDFEASAGYHKFVTEMLLYTFLLAKRNTIDIDERYWVKLRSMLSVIRASMRPDGYVPLIGDADGSQIVPVIKRDADDQAYLLQLGAIVLDHPELADSVRPTPEVLWLTGSEGVDRLRSIAVPSDPVASTAFVDAGYYIMRDGEFYVHFNASDCGLNGRGSHGHNDALSIELSVYGRPFIIDPGSYVYNLDRKARHLFRSTAYHSTVTVDGEEQNTTNRDTPFVLGNEAAPNVDKWESTAAFDIVSASHPGYERFASPVSHRRTIRLDKAEKYWLITDMLAGAGRHDLVFSFHTAPGLTIGEVDNATVEIGGGGGPSVIIRAVGLISAPEIVPAYASRNYGHREPTQILRWRAATDLPFTARFVIVPCDTDENKPSGLELINRLTDNIDN